MKYLKYAMSRVVSCALVIFLAATVLYLLPMIKGDMGYPLSVEGYMAFLKSVVRMDFGFSKFYKADIGEIVWRYMPYTMGMCIFSNVTAWILGNAIGLMAGCARGKIFPRIAEALSMIVYPVPYFILALLVQIVFAYLLGLFPITSEIMTNRGTEVFIKTLLRSSTLPALTMMLSALGWWTLSMSALSGAARGEEYVQFAYLRGISDRVIARRYIRPNCMLPQVTALAIQLGGAFGGSIMTEMVFNYPGVGFLMERAAMYNDYNLLYGASIISVIAIAAAAAMVDLIYPLIDPRVSLN